MEVHDEITICVVDIFVDDLIYWNIWGVLEMTLHGMSHSIYKLPAYLHLQHSLLFKEGYEGEDLAKNKITVSTYFEQNKVDSTSKNIICYKNVPDLLSE